jgi:uncharacterized protein (UPF0254 family)
MFHIDFSLPDDLGTHGWTATGSPSTSSNIVRLWIGSVSAGGDWFEIWLDSWDFWARKKLTSKYTVSNIINTARIATKKPYNKVHVVRTGGTDTEEDTTLESADGVQELVYADMNITTEAIGRGLARMVLEHEYMIESDAVAVTVINPGDMYNLMLSDTVTVTAANLGLSSALRILAERQDTVDNGGWKTTLTLNTKKPREGAGQVYALLNPKRR